MKKLIYIATLALAASLTVSCGEEYPSTDYMILEDVQYVKQFPQTFSINNAEEVNTDIIGILDFSIYDSLLILSARDNKGLWSFLSLPDCHFLGKFLTQGQGPYEFFHCPFIYRQTIFKEKGALYAGIYDFATGAVYKMNIDESLQNKRLSIHKIKSLSPFIFSFVMLDSTRFFCKEINSTQTQQLRYIWDNNQKNTPPHLEKLNKSRIKEGEDHNILSTFTQYNAEMIEMPLELNYINMYSIDGTFGKTFSTT